MYLFRSHTTPRGDLESDGSPLSAYLGEIGATRVLSRVEEQAMARRFRARRAAVHELLAGIPFTTRALVGIGQLRGTIAPAFPPRGAGDPESAAGRRALLVRVERRLQRVLRLAERRGVDEAAWQRFEVRQRRDLLALEASPDFYRDVEVALRERLRELDAAKRARARLLRDEVGLPLRRFRRRMTELASAAAARDRARNDLARHNLKLVVRFAKQYRNLGVAFSDLIQEGNVGLLRAVELFDPERGLKFSTYAVWWIRQALVRALQRHSRSVRLPSHVMERLHQVGRATARLESCLGRRPSTRELARDLSLEWERVEQLRALGRPSLSLDGAPEPDGPAPLQERLADARTQSPLDGIDAARDHRRVGVLLTRLEPREQAVITRRFGFCGEEAVSLECLARELGISREFVRRIERTALGKLRDWAERPDAS